MSSKNTVNVVVSNNQTQSYKIPEQYKNMDTNMKCSNTDCSNIANNVYIVSTSNINKEFIAPLCKDCYKNNTNYSTEDFQCFGEMISIERDALVENNI